MCTHIYNLYVWRYTHILTHTYKWTMENIREISLVLVTTSLCFEYATLVFRICLLIWTIACICYYFLLVLNGTYDFLSVAGIPTLQKRNEPFKTSEAFLVPVIALSLALWVSLQRYGKLPLVKLVWEKHKIHNSDIFNTIMHRLDKIRPFITSLIWTSNFKFLLKISLAWKYLDLQAKQTIMWYF